MRVPVDVADDHVARLVVGRGRVLEGEDARPVVEEDVDAVDVLQRDREVRIPVVVESVLQPEGEPVRDVIRRRSERADLVFMGMARVDAGDELAAAERLVEQLDGMPSTILVRNGSRFQGRLV